MTYIGTAGRARRHTQEGSRGSSGGGMPRTGQPRQRGWPLVAAGGCLLVLAASALAQARVDVFPAPTVAPSARSTRVDRPLEGPLGPRGASGSSFLGGLGSVVTAPARRAAGSVPSTAVLLPPPPPPPAPAGRPGVFTRPLDLDSVFFPVVTGTRFSYEGTVTDDDGTHRHRLVLVVTDLVKKVDGVDARVVLDRDYSDGLLVESELTFFAQDDAGNVWTRGEYPEEYEDGEFVGAPSTWITGVRGARAGILVPGVPAAGGAPFVQGRAPAVGFNDVGQVVADGLRVCVPTGCYADVVEIRESAPDDPDDGIQLKYYAPHVGGVRIAARGGDSRETMTLRSARRLGPDDLEAARDAALRLDHRARDVSEDYRATGPARVLR